MEEKFTCICTGLTRMCRTFNKLGDSEFKMTWGTNDSCGNSFFVVAKAPTKTHKLVCLLDDDMLNDIVHADNDPDSLLECANSLSWYKI